MNISLSNQAVHNLPQDTGGEDAHGAERGHLHLEGWGCHQVR
jgi:hypothetical protein